MILTIEDLLIRYDAYADPYGKIKREVDSGNLFPLVKGLYETSSLTPGYFLSAYIYGPSYLSFEFALSYHGLIPEKVVVYTSATYGKNKKKEYKNKFGLYRYRDVPKKAYPYGIKAEFIDNYSILIATPEKAICDKLYIYEPQKDINALKYLLFEDLRVSKAEFIKLNMNEMIFLCSLYRSKNINLLRKMLQEGINI